MKKILLVTRPIAPPWDEASKNFAYYLAKTIGDSKDFELHLMTRGKLPELPDSIVQDEVYTASQNDFTFSQKIRSLFFQFIVKNQFDVIHYFFTPTKLNSFFIKHLLKSKKTKSIQTVATLREDLFSDEEIKKMMFGDLIVTYSEYAKNKLNALGFQNVKRVSPGIDMEKYQLRKKNSELMKKCGFGEQDFILNFTAEYVRLGAMDDVLESFILLSQKIPNLKLSLALRVKNERDATKKKEVMKKLQEKNLLENVSFHDEVDERFDVSDIYNLCDVSLYPVRNMYGKFDIPLAVVESMACEKPIILSDLPIFSELGNEDNSVIIKSGDVNEIVEAVLDLYNHPEKKRTIGKNARKFVEERFDIEKVAKQYEEIYKTL